MLGMRHFEKKNLDYYFVSLTRKKDRVAKYKGTLQFIKMLDSLHCFKFIHMLIPYFFLS